MSPTETDEGMASPETLGAKVYRQLRDLLVTGQLEPGEKISLRSLAQSLDVSVQPVREAVSRLIADEALEVLPNRAVRVPMMTDRRFEELTRVRLAIEGFAVETAAIAREDGDLDAVRRLDQLFRQVSRQARPDFAAAVLANRDLHFTIYGAARLASLIPIIEGLWLRVGPVLNLDLRTDPERLRSGHAANCHARMLAAIEARDPAAARDALADDIEGAARVIRKHHVIAA